MTLLFGGGKSVKDKIILALGSSWPLNAKELLAHIKNNFDVNVTYQAVYKSINELLEEGVIVKIDKGFELNRSWVSSLKEYMTSVDQSYRTNTPKKDVADSEQIIVDSIYDFYLFILKMMEKYANDSHVTQNPVVFRAIHGWNALVVGKEELIRVAKVVPNYKLYVVVSSDSPLDHALAKYWRELGVHFKTNVPLTITNDVVVVGDYVVQIIYPNELINALNIFFEETKSLEEMDIIKSQRDIFYKKMHIPVITVKNKMLADDLKKETLGYFK